MKTFSLAAILPTPPLDFGATLALAEDLGFEAVEVTALPVRPPEHGEMLADSGLLVCCASLGHGLPQGRGLDAAPLEARRAALDLLQRQVADAALLGATRAYLPAGTDPSPEALSRFAEGCGLLADFAARRMVRLCLAPVPGHALPTTTAALSWLESSGLDGVGLLLDVRHCAAGGEDQAEVVRRVGRRLNHVHLGGDPLARASQEKLLSALEETGYDGYLAVEIGSHPGAAS